MNKKTADLKTVAGIHSQILQEIFQAFKTPLVRRSCAKGILILVFLGVFFCSFVYTFPIAAAAGRQVLLLDIPRFDLAEVSPRYPELLKLAQSGAAGIMTVPFSDPLTFDEVYLGFNSGRQIKTYPKTYTFLNSSEYINGRQAGAVYYNFTGLKAPAAGAVSLEMPVILGENDQTVRFSLGLFGKLLHKNGMRTAVIGNADADILNRYAAAMLMDQRGSVDWGALGAETLTGDPMFPYGLRTDPDKILTFWNNFKQNAQVTEITLGDFERIERFGGYLSNSRWKHFRALTLQRYDSLVGRLISQIDFNNTLLIVLTGLPPGKDPATNPRLTPVIIKGPGFGTGLLYSNSTRRPGIITCYDLPATILNFLNVKTPGFYNASTLKTTGGDWRGIVTEQKSLAVNYQVRWPLLTAYGYLLIGLFLLALLGIIFGFKFKQFNWLTTVYLFLLTLPAVFLIEALVNPLNWPAIAAWTLGLAGIIFGVAFGASRGDLFKTLGKISFFTVIVVLLDLIFNGFCELKSFLGYSAVAGARFYGIGNEYMGVLLGAYIVTVSVYYDKLKRRHSQVLWLTVLLITLFIIHPNLGSSIGGGLTALAGLGITVYLWLERPVRFKEIVALFGALVLVLLLAGLWDYFINKSSMTHLGQLITSIIKSGFKATGEIAVRKLQLNLRLINYSIWCTVLVVLLAVIPFIYKKPPAFMAGVLARYPGIARGFLGLTITAIFALLINDSGIVSAAMMYVFGLNLLLVVAGQEWASKTGTINLER